MEQIYNNEMARLGYTQFVCDIFADWEDVKDEILSPDRKNGSGNGTVHVFLGAADADLQNEFSSYYSSVRNGEDPSLGAITITHYFMPNNIVSMLGFVCKYYSEKNESAEPHVGNIIRDLSSFTLNSGLLETTSLLKLSVGSSKLRPYFKQFESNGVFHKVVRPVLVPSSAYKIALYKNSQGEYAAFWLIGADSLSNFEANSSTAYTKKKIKGIDTNIDFITAIRTKPFLLLAGISGTGKSRIVRQLARACDTIDGNPKTVQKPANFEMVQVKPNWHDSSELIGYVSRIDGEKFIAGDFLKFVAKAWENNKEISGEDSSVPFFLCLDEMNLAPVEQYFAEYLSVIESRKLNEEGKIVTDPILKAEPQQWYHDLVPTLTEDATLQEKLIKEGITIPDNLIVIGTVNMDETTYSFSRKVLDRAMTIEMNEVNLLGGLTDESYDDMGTITPKQILADSVEGKDVYAGNEDVCNSVINNYLQPVNDVLEGTPFKIAYRTRNEFLLYVINSIRLSGFTDKDKQGPVIVKALDEVTGMKILSRIEGDETKVSKEFLEKLKTTISDGLKAFAEAEYVDKKTDEDKENNKMFSSSLAKLTAMYTKLDKTGYTSFWD